MFLDSLVAQKFDIHIKALYIINHGLAPHFKKYCSKTYTELKLKDSIWSNGYYYTILG